MLPEITRIALESTPLPPDEAALYELCLHDKDAFAAALPQDNGLTALKLILHWLPQMRARYDALSIPEATYLDNLKDITIWCEDFIAKTGKPGLRTWAWVCKSLRLELIRLVRLQFEPTVLEEDITLQGQTFPAGTPTLSVHIPAGEPLDPEAVLASFRMAEDFFPRYFGTEYPLYFCHSWLMASSLKEILPANSRIMMFQRMFDVQTEFPDHQAEERVFGHLADDPNSYPENTSLQRALKAWLLAGHETQAAVGARLWRASYLEESAHA